MKIRNILVPSSLGASDKALDYAVELARVFDATIHLLHVVEMPIVADPMLGGVPLAYPSAAVMDEARHFLEDIRARLPVRTTLVVERGIPAEAILRHATQENIDLIVMATHGRRGLARMLMGSTTETVLRSAPCPVVSVRPSAVHLEEQPAEATVDRSGKS